MSASPSNEGENCFSFSVLKANPHSKGSKQFQKMKKIFKKLQLLISEILVRKLWLF